MPVFVRAKADSICLSRHLPSVGYARRRPEDAFCAEKAGNEGWGAETRLESAGAGVLAAYRDDGSAA